MVSHDWKKLDGFPVAFVVVFSVGAVLPLIIALSNGHVTPYVPYISEGGGMFPEAGVFSFFVSISAFICQWIMCLRYLLVEQLISKKVNDLNTFFNKMSFVLGGLSTVFMLIITSYPASTISQVHSTAVAAASVCYVMHLIFQTWLNFRILGKTKMSKVRLALTILSAMALIAVTLFGVLGLTQWNASHWSGRKTPKDKGFAFYVVSASAEWILAILLLAYFSTYIPDFKKSTFKFQLEIEGDQPSNPPRLSNLDVRRP